MKIGMTALCTIQKSYIKISPKGKIKKTLVRLKGFPRMVRASPHMLLRSPHAIRTFPLTKKSFPESKRMSEKTMKAQRDSAKTSTASLVKIL
jgi:hypothetical protein